MNAADLPLPPGSNGWPIVGEALTFAANPFHFVRDRAASHGAVCRTRLLDKDLVILAGPATVDAFLDEENIARGGGLPPHAAALFGEGVVNQIDGEAHRARKQHLMRALDHEALAHYLPKMREVIRARIASWVERKEASLQRDGVLLTLQLLLANFADIERDDAELERVAAGYTAFGKALVGLPLALPGTPLARARAFNAEMHALFEGLANTRREAPTGDGVSRLAGSEVNGARLASRDIALEMQHLVFAGSGLWGWFCYGAKALHDDPKLREALRAEAAALPDEPSGRELLEAPGLNAFVREVKRLAMIIPITAIGVARREFAVAGHRVPAGWLALWTTWGSHVIPGLAPYESPERFDPSRYARGEGEGKHHFAPQGPGEALTSHRCGGVEYSTLATLQFFCELLRAPEFTVPPQDLSQDMSRLPAGWRGGLRVRFV